MNHFYQSITTTKNFNYQDVLTNAVSQAQSGDSFVVVGDYFGTLTAYLTVEIHNSGKSIIPQVIDYLQNYPVTMEVSAFDKFDTNLSSVVGKFSVTRTSSADALSLFSANSLQYIFIDNGSVIDNSREKQIFQDDLIRWIEKLKPGAKVSGTDANNPDISAAFTEINVLTDGEFSSNLVIDARNVWTYTKPV
jgi:hypothetical protein